MSFDDLSAIIRDAKGGNELTRKHAQAILDKGPVVTKEQNRYWLAWLELQADRPQSMAGYPLIPLSAIREYCNDLEMTALERYRTIRIVRAMDNRMATIISDKQSAK